MICISATTGYGKCYSPFTLNVSGVSPISLLYMTVQDFLPIKSRSGSHDIVEKFLKITINTNHSNNTNHLAIYDENNCCHILVN